MARSGVYPETRTPAGERALISSSSETCGPYFMVPGVSWPLLLLSPLYSRCSLEFDRSQDIYSLSNRSL